jgi:hypothetical protein
LPSAAALMMITVIVNDLKTVYATDPFIIKDNKEPKFASPFIVEVDERKLFVLAFEEIVYAKGKVSKQT